MTEKIRDVNQRLAILRERRSVTSFVDQVVPKGTLLELIEYSILAPSSGNRQAWRFIIVNDNSLIKKLVDLGGSNTINKSQCGILVNYDNHALTPDYRDDFQTAAACIQNLLLAAQAYGLGACWVTILPPKTTLRKLFNIPWYYSPIAYVVVGYPDSTKSRDVPRKNNIEDIVSENTFPMQGLGRKSRARNNIKLLSAWIYGKLPITLKKRLSK
jgi:nitroreductase